MNINLKDFYKKLRIVMEDKEVTMVELADRADIHYNYICTMFKYHKDLRLSSLLRLATALEIDPSELL